MSPNNKKRFVFFLSQTNWRGRCFQTSNNKKRLKLFYKTNSSFFPNQIGEEEDVSKQQETFFLFPKWRGGRGLQAPTTNVFSLPQKAGRKMSVLADCVRTPVAKPISLWRWRTGVNRTPDGVRVVGTQMRLTGMLSYVILSVSVLFVCSFHCYLFVCHLCQ